MYHSLAQNPNCRAKHNSGCFGSQGSLYADMHSHPRGGMATECKVGISTLIRRMSCGRENEVLHHDSGSQRGSRMDVRSISGIE